ncbi:MAG: helix-hairpin-helix domain-containing protein [Pseudomonadota bacterium]
MTYFHRLVIRMVLVGLLAFSALGLVPPKTDRRSFNCSYPIGIRLHGRTIVRCFDNPGPYYQEEMFKVLQWARVPECVSKGLKIERVVVGDLLVIEGCTIRLQRISAQQRLTLGMTLDLNYVSAEDLQVLPRIGPVLSGRIVANREKLGRFHSVIELQRVKGIGPVTVRQLLPYLHVVPDAEQTLRNLPNKK